MESQQRSTECQFLAIGVNGSSHDPMCLAHPLGRAGRLPLVEAAPIRDSGSSQPGDHRSLFGNQLSIQAATFRRPWIGAPRPLRLTRRVRYPGLDDHDARNQYDHLFSDDAPTPINNTRSGCGQNPRRTEPCAPGSRRCSRRRRVGGIGDGHDVERQFSALGAQRRGALHGPGKRYRRSCQPGPCHR